MTFIFGMMIGSFLGLVMAGLLASGKTEDLYRENAILKEQIRLLNE